MTAACARRRKGGRFEDSLDKLGYLLRECEARGVHTRTLRVPLCGGSRSLWVVPLLAWHHQSWDREPPITGLQLPPFESCMSDYRCCTWPEGIPGCDDPKSDACARLLDAFEGRNDEAVALLARERRAGDVVISCSHFLPHQCLMPTKRMLFMPELPKACGSDLLRPRIDALGGVGAHVFGHTHFAWDMDVDSVRFLSCPLAYPTERRNNMNGGGEWVPLRVWEVEPTALDGPGGAAGDGELGERCVAMAEQVHGSSALRGADARPTFPPARPSVTIVNVRVCVRARVRVRVHAPQRRVW